jgi:hypothetical protein
MDADFRKKNGLVQKMFLVKMEYNKNELFFHILGTSSHVYKIKYNTFQSIPKCSCPDSTFRKVVCKHVHFLSNKVLGEYKDIRFTIDSLHEFYTQTLEKLPHLNGLYSKDIEKEYNKVIKASQDVLGKKIPSEKEPRNTECCICLENLQSTFSENTPIIVCKTCENGLHKVCWDTWSKFTRNNTCTFCRTINEKEKLASFTDCVGNLKL